MFDCICTIGHTRRVKTKALEVLRAHNVQVTAQRLMVLGAVMQHPHATADEVTTCVRSEVGAISRQSVYDSLGLLVEKGLLQRIHVAGSSARFEARVGDNHHHLVCSSCDEVVDVDCAVGSAPCLTPSDDWSYDVAQAEVVYRGTCQRCKASGSPVTYAQQRAKSPESTHQEHA